MSNVRESFDKHKERINRNKEYFNKMMSLSNDELIKICERFLMDKSSLQYLLDPKWEGTLKDFYVSYINWNSSGWTPYEIKYIIKYYDNIEIKINVCEAVIFEQMQHCSGFEKVNIDFLDFYNEYIK